MSARAARKMGRVPLPESELYILRDAELSPPTCEALLEFYRAYQRRVLLFFLKMKYDWQEKYPGRRFPGVCAVVDSITGRMLPLAEQRAWTWGDGRGLGIWAAFLIKGRTADESAVIRLGSGAERTVNLRAEYGAYCDHIYRCLVERYESCGGHMPFMADIETNRPSKDPRNVIAGPGQVTASDIFCVTATQQYGLLRGDRRAFEIGDDLLRKCCDAARTGGYPREEGSKGHQFQGSAMVTVGAVVDVLKSIAVLERRGVTEHAERKQRLIDAGREMVDGLLGNFYDPKTHEYWEENDAAGKPFINRFGQKICDPGHTAEACGFFAELCAFLPETESGTGWRWSRKAIIEATLGMCDLVTRRGFSERGVMFKNIDLLTGQGVADTSGGGTGRATAPWWNVREHSAACLRLYVLTGDPRCLEGYRKSQNASYLHYPNANIGGLMVQTVDPYTLEALDVHPATGNLDPMHDPRAREREIEALEQLLPRLG